MNSLDLSKEDSVDLDCLIKCMYSYDLETTNRPLLRLVSLYAVASRLLVPVIANLALCHLKDAFLFMREDHVKDTRLTISAFKCFCNDLPAMVKVAWTELPQENNPLRAMIVGELVCYSERLNLKRERESFEEAFAISKTFALDLLFAVDTRDC